MCDQQRLRPACAYAQSDQSLCLWLEYSMTVKLLTEHHLEFLSLKGGCTGSSESTLIKMPHCWKSHVVAHLSFTEATRTQNKAKRKTEGTRGICETERESISEGREDSLLPEER